MVSILKKEGNTITLQVSMSLEGSMLEMENQIQHYVNQVGTVATNEALSRFDTSGAPIQLGSIKMTAFKKKQKKDYETPYGRVSLERHVYQTSKGGRVYCPLDERARIIISSTPKFGQMISYKYASLSARELCEDLEQNHSRHITRGFVQNVSDTIGTIAQATEETFDYSVPEFSDPISTVSVSLDGTCVLMKKGGYREAMTGNLSLYNNEGERLHTVYIASAPEHGKNTFTNHLQKEIDKIKNKYPSANYVGISDGASTNWSFLEPNTEHYILDFYHATEYLSGASGAFGRTEKARKEWLETACHRLKHEKDAAQHLLVEMETQQEVVVGKKNTAKIVKEKLQNAITYFTNQCHRMDYKKYQEQKFPIGSGVTEAACKTLVKQRLCKSGMQWKTKGAAVVLALRSLVKTTGRWNQFWSKLCMLGIGDFIAA